MIIDLPTHDLVEDQPSLVDLREKGGSVALGRVLTLVIVTDEAQSEDPIAAANAASFEHPCRVIVVARGLQARLGADGRADPGRRRRRRQRGDRAAAVRPAGRPRRVGRRAAAAGRRAGGRLVAGRGAGGAGRGPDRAAGAAPDHRRRRRRSGRSPSWPSGATSYRPGDTDLAWTRITRWRGLLASTLDQPPHDKVHRRRRWPARPTRRPPTCSPAGWRCAAMPGQRVKSPAKAGPGCIRSC